LLLLSSSSSSSSWLLLFYVGLIPPRSADRPTTRPAFARPRSPVTYDVVSCIYEGSALASGEKQVEHLLCRFDRLVCTDTDVSAIKIDRRPAFQPRDDHPQREVWRRGGKARKSIMELGSTAKPCKVSTSRSSGGWLTHVVREEIEPLHRPGRSPNRVSLLLLLPADHVHGQHDVDHPR
jgi:hypothetical protein